MEFWKLGAVYFCTVKTFSSFQQLGAGRAVEDNQKKKKIPSKVSPACSSHVHGSTASQWDLSWKLKDLVLEVYKLTSCTNRLFVCLFFFFCYRSAKETSDLKEKLRQIEGDKMEEVAELAARLRSQQLANNNKVRLQLPQCAWVCVWGGVWGCVCVWVTKWRRLQNKQLGWDHNSLQITIRWGYYCHSVPECVCVCGGGGCVWEWQNGGGCRING